MDLGMDDGTSSWWLNPDGYWTRHNRDESATRCVTCRRRWSGNDGSVRPMSRAYGRPRAPCAGAPVTSPVSELILAAGAVVWRPAAGGTEVLLIHRPRYDDWSLPKGKREPGEHLLLTAVREVFEETSVRPVLGPRLPHDGVPGRRPAQAGRLLVRGRPGRRGRGQPRDRRPVLGAARAGAGHLSYAHDAAVLAACGRADGPADPAQARLGGPERPGTGDDLRGRWTPRAPRRAAAGRPAGLLRPPRPGPVTRRRCGARDGAPVRGGLRRVRRG